MLQAAKESGQSPEDVKRKQPSSDEKVEHERSPQDDEAMETDIKKPRNTVLIIGAKELETNGIDIGYIDTIDIKSLSPYTGPKRNDTRGASDYRHEFDTVEDVAALSICVDSFRKFYLVKRSDGQQVLVTKWNDKPDGVMYYSK